MDEFYSDIFKNSARFGDFNIMNDAFVNPYNDENNNVNDNVNDGGALAYRRRKMYENIRKGNFVDVKWTEVNENESEDK